jgi:hypothetical protein
MRNKSPRYSALPGRPARVAGAIIAMIGHAQMVAKDSRVHFREVQHLGSDRGGRAAGHLRQARTRQYSLRAPVGHTEVSSFRSVRGGGHLDRGIYRYLRCCNARGFIWDNSASWTVGPTSPASDSRADVNRRDGLDIAVLLPPPGRERLTDKKKAISGRTHNGVTEFRREKCHD